VLVNKSHNKTPYELFNGRSPAIGFLKPFGCHVMILNTLDNLGKFEEKGDEVDAGTISTNLLGTKDTTSQEAHDALLEFSSSKPQDHCSTKVPEGSGNPNHTASMSYPPADQMETLTVETPIPTVSSPVLTAYSTDSQEPSSDARLISKRVANQEETPSLDNILSLINQFKDILGITINSDESNGVEADISNMETAITASPTPTLRIYKDHPKSQIIGPLDTLIQTRNKSKETLVDCPKGVRPIGTKWVLKNKKDEKGIVFRNKAMLVAQGHTQEERIDYDGVFAHVARIKAIRIFLAYASFMGFTVYQMDVKSAFLFGTIDEEVHQVTPKECHLHAVKRIFRYLKDHPNLGLWYPKESPFDLVAYSDSDYGGATQDRKSTTEGCQFLGRRLSMPCEALSRDFSTSILRLSNSEQRTHEFIHIYLASASVYVWIGEHNIEFHPMVDFIEASLLRARIAQSSALPTIADEPASPLRDVSQGEACPTDFGFIVDQDRATITKSSTLPHDSAPRVTSPAADEGKDRDGVATQRSRDDALIKGRSLDEGEAAAERISDDSEEMATVLTSMDAATVLTVKIADVPTGSGSIPNASPPADEVSTGSDVVSTASLVFSTATVIDAQVTRELEEQLEREDQRRSEQIARDAEIVRIHAEEELQIMIDALERNNETVAKYLQEYHQFASELPMERRIELISDLVKYQDNYAKVKDFRGMTFKEVKAKFNSVWKPLEDFIPMSSKEEAERIKRKGLSMEQESAKRQKISEEVTEEAKSSDEVPKEKVKEMMQLVSIEEVYVEALQRLVKETLNNRPPTSNKEIELWVELSRFYEPDHEDQLWTHTQNFMYTSIEWKLYDSCGVHHVTSKDKEIFMREGLPSKEGSSTCDDQLQASSRELLTDGE
nr:retrovirus-related Pol polyprotein from transposon TNT 1-94 [Tanacetum cinerariifolium]